MAKKVEGLGPKLVFKVKGRKGRWIWQETRGVRGLAVLVCKRTRGRGGVGSQKLRETVSRELHVYI